MSKEAVAIADPAGAAQPPREKPPVAAAVQDPADFTICPETSKPCEEKPQCDLKNNTGRTYCVVWVKRIRTEEIQRRLKNAQSDNT